MNQITRTPEPPQQRIEPQRGPRGEELQQASNQFAELLTKGHKETKAHKARDEKLDADEVGGECVDAESRSDRTDALPYGLRLPGERGQDSEHSQQSDHSHDSQHPQHGQPWQDQPQQDQPHQRFIVAAEPANDACRPGDADYGEKVDSQRHLGPPIRTVDPDPSLDRTLLGPPKRAVDPDPRFDSMIQAEANVGERSVAVEQLPTPGDLMLQAFAATRIETPLVMKTEAPALAAPIPHADVDAIRELGLQIAERILVLRTESAGPQEMLIQLKDSALAGTEVRMTHNGDRLQVTLVTDNASSFHLLAARQADLQAKLGDAVVIQLSFDPEGMISQQRMERPLAAESSQQSGDRNRERDTGDRRRDQRRDKQQDPDS